MLMGEMTLLSVHQLRPYAHLLRQYTIAIAACVVPLFALMYWMALPADVLTHVIIAQVLVVVMWAVSYVAYKRACILVTSSGLTERGFFGQMNVVPTSSIGSIIMLELYRSGSLDTHPQLFVIDPDGRPLLRMRGQFWSRKAMNIVVDALDVPVVRVPEPLSLRDLNRLRPELLYWFERRPASKAQ